MARRLRIALRAAALAALMGFASFATPASAEEVGEVVKKVEARYEGVTSLKATFSQTTHNEIFGDETVTGTLAVKRPAMMRWAFGTEKLFVTDGKKMWIYTAADKQVIEYEDISANRSTADSLLTSLDKLNEHFKIELLSAGEKGYELMLKPNEEGQFKQVRLTLDPALMVKNVVITDTFDNVTELTFTDVELNAVSDDSIFSFKAPDGVDVVKGGTN